MATYEIASLTRTQTNVPAGHPRLASSSLQLAQAIICVAKNVGVCAYYLALAPFLIPFVPFVVLAWLLRWTTEESEMPAETDRQQSLPADIQEPAWQAGTAGTIPAHVTGYH